MVIFVTEADSASIVRQRSRQSSARAVEARAAARAISAWRRALSELLDCAGDADVSPAVPAAPAALAIASGGLDDLGVDFDAAATGPAAAFGEE